MEVFHIYLKISYFISIQITMVFFCFYFLVFISPGLFNFEYKKIWYSWIFCVIIWIIILLYMYKYLLPWSWKFFLSFQHFSSNQNINIYFESKLSEFFNFCFYFFNIIFIIYIIFIILCLYINFLLKNIQLIKNFRKNFYFMFFVIASLITPPDIISQIFVGLTIIIFYEIIILFYFVNNKFKKY